MRYLLRKTTPRLSSRHEIYETTDGDVARLLSMNGQPLSPDAEQKRSSRLSELAADPGRQRHRKQTEDADRGARCQCLRALPDAFHLSVCRHRAEPRGTGGKIHFPAQSRLFAARSRNPGSDRHGRRNLDQSRSRSAWCGWRAICNTTSISAGAFWADWTKAAGLPSTRPKWVPASGAPCACRW